MIPYNPWVIVGLPPLGSDTTRVDSVNLVRSRDGRLWVPIRGTTTSELGFAVFDGASVSALPVTTADVYAAAPGSSGIVVALSDAGPTRFRIARITEAEVTELGSPPMGAIALAESPAGVTYAWSQASAADTPAVWRRGPGGWAPLAEQPTVGATEVVVAITTSGETVLAGWASRTIAEIYRLESDETWSLIGRTASDLNLKIAAGDAGAAFASVFSGYFVRGMYVASPLFGSTPDVSSMSLTFDATPPTVLAALDTVGNEWAAVDGWGVVTSPAAGVAYSYPFPTADYSAAFAVLGTRPFLIRGLTLFAANRIR